MQWSNFKIARRKVNAELLAISALIFTTISRVSLMLPRGHTNAFVFLKPRGEDITYMMKTASYSCASCGCKINDLEIYDGTERMCPGCGRWTVLRREDGFLMCFCSECNGKIEFPDHAVASWVDCPHCGKKITLTDDSKLADAQKRLLRPIAETGTQGVGHWEKRVQRIILIAGGSVLLMILILAGFKGSEKSFHDPILKARLTTLAVRLHSDQNVDTGIEELIEILAVYKTAMTPEQTAELEKALDSLVKLVQARELFWKTQKDQYLQQITHLMPAARENVQKAAGSM